MSFILYDLNGKSTAYTNKTVFQSLVPSSPGLPSNINDTLINSLETLNETTSTSTTVSLQDNYNSYLETAKERIKELEKIPYVSFFSR